MPVLSARKLVKAFGGEPLFRDLSLTITRGERVGLLGQNGSGKSTLLKALAGEEPVDEGIIERRRDATILYLHQEPPLDPKETPRAIIASGLHEWRKTKAEYDEVSHALTHGGGADEDALVTRQATLAEAIDRLGGWEQEHVVEDFAEKLSILELDRPVGSMSGGERRRIALARLLIARPDLAILDEPTNHLDAETIEWLEKHLAEEFSGAVLMVTHDRYVLDAVCNRILELENGGLTEFRGNYSDYVEQKAELVAHGERVEQNRLNLLRRERAWLQRGAKARSTKQKARIQRAEALIRVEGPRDAKNVSLSGATQGVRRMGKTILEVENASIELGGRTLISDLTLRMVAGDRIGVVGRNGVGKTSFLRLITGELLPTSGKVTLGLNTRVAVVDQARAALVDDWTIFDNVAEREGAERAGGGTVTFGERTLELRQYLELFLFEGKKQRQKVGSLSGGERARVGLAKILKNGANLLLLDEPTNDLDVSTLAALEELLESWPGCAVVVSHDRAFLNNVATSILAFEGEGRVLLYPGGYDTYRSLRAENELARAAPKDGASRISKTDPPRSEKTKASTPKIDVKPLNFAEKKELETILDRIAECEGRAARLAVEMTNPALYADRASEAPKLKADHDAAVREVEKLTLRWEELEARRAIRK